MKKYEYKISAFGKIRQEKEQKKKENKKPCRVCPWRAYAI